MPASALALCATLLLAAAAGSEDPVARADSLAAAGDAEGALRVLEEALRADPSRRSAWVRLGGLRLAAGRAAEAAEAFEKALSLRPDPRTMYDAARAHARAGNRDLALSWLGKSAATGFVSPERLDAEADLASLRGDPRYAEARDRAARASEPCRFQPESRQLDFWLGEWLVHRSGETEVVGESRIEKILSASTSGTGAPASGGRPGSIGPGTSRTSSTGSCAAAPCTSGPIRAPRTARPWSGAWSSRPSARTGCDSAPGGPPTAALPGATSTTSSTSAGSDGRAPLAPYFSLGTFSQSARNFLSPASVSGWRASCSMTAKGMVATSAPRRAACTTCCGWRTEATRTCVENS